MNDYCFGIDVGGTSVKAGLFSKTGELLKKYEFATRKEENGKYILNDIADFVEKEIVKSKLNKRDFTGIGIGVPGSVNEEGIVNKCINLGWGVINIPEILGQKTGLKVSVGNDANMAALGEYWKGSASGYSSTLLITLGTGVGGGIIIDGVPLNGYHGAAAEIGHLPVALDETEKCNCGKIGCLEQVASATGIVKKANCFLEKQTIFSKLRDFENFTAKEVFDCAKDGDKIALEVVDYISKHLGIALACASIMIDTQCIIIGGGVSAAGEFLLDKVTEYYREYVFHPCLETEIFLAKLGNDAGIYGAARLIIGKEG